LKWIVVIFLFPLFLEPAAQAGDPLTLPAAIRPFLAPENFVPDASRVARVMGEVEAITKDGGKRLRPILCYLAGGTLGVEPNEIVPMACIAEWAHTASLVHDDIIDNSDTRRGKRSTHKKIGTKKAILVGDWLLARLVRLAMKTGQPEAADGMLKVIEGMVEGEFLQDELISREQYTLAEYEQVSFLKTGLLFAWAMKTPFLFRPSSSPELLSRFEAFGRKLAFIFQKRDDWDDADQPGEINAVFLHASRIEQCSPLSTCFRADTVQTAAGIVKEEIQWEVGDWLSDLKSLQAEAAHISQREGWSQPARAYQQACFQTLSQIGELQRLFP